MKSLSSHVSRFVSIPYVELRAISQAGENLSRQQLKSNVGVVYSLCIYTVLYSPTGLMACHWSLRDTILSELH